MPRSSTGHLQRLFAKVHLVLICTLFSAGAGCAPGEPKIGIEAPSAELSPVFLGVASVFLTIRNDGGRDALVGASVNIPGALVELHDVKDRRMLKVERIPVRSRGSVELKPGSQHLMIYNLPRTLQEGAEIELMLRFERSGERRVPVRLAKPAGS
jgi:periplasmic copper chaperone A